MRVLAGQRLEEQDPERVEVRAAVDVRVAGGLLGGHVAQGPEHGARLRELLVLLEPQPREAEVEDLGAKRGRVAGGAAEEHVVGLQISVDHAGVVRGGEALGEGDPERRDVGGGEAMLAAHARGERLALEELHREPGATLVLAGVEDLHNRRMPTARGGDPLLHEAPRGELRRERLGEQLERDLPLQRLVGRDVDHAATAGAKEALDAVLAADEVTGSEGHFSWGERIPAA